LIGGESLYDKSLDLIYRGRTDQARDYHHRHQRIFTKQLPVPETFREKEKRKQRQPTPPPLFIIPINAIKIPPIDFILIFTPKVALVAFGRHKCCGCGCGYSCSLWLYNYLLVSVSPFFFIFFFF